MALGDLRFGGGIGRGGGGCGGERGEGAGGGGLGEGGEGGEGGVEGGGGGAGGEGEASFAVRQTYRWNESHDACCTVGGTVSEPAGK